MHRTDDSRVRIETALKIDQVLGETMEWMLAFIGFVAMAPSVEEVWSRRQTVATIFAAYVFLATAHA